MQPTNQRTSKEICSLHRWKGLHECSLSASYTYRRGGVKAAYSCNDIHLCFASIIFLLLKNFIFSFLLRKLFLRSESYTVRVGLES